MIWVSDRGRNGVIYEAPENNYQVATTDELYY